MSQTKAAFDAIFATAEAIRQAGQIPAAHVYAHLLGVMTLESFEAIIRTLIGAGLVSRDSSHMLTWVGPMLEEK